MECEVRSVECRVWSVKCGVWSVECHCMSQHVTPATALHIVTTALIPSKRKGFGASPIDTGTAEENERLETRHVGASKRAFRARIPQNVTLRSFKIDVFLRVFLRT